MEFSEKLTFLMRITDTTNRELGETLGIHQSQISRMRNGTRGLPGNVNYVSQMAIFFAKRFRDDYQRSALAEAMGRPALLLPASLDVLALSLNEWMNGAYAESRSQNETALGSGKSDTGIEGRGTYVYFGDRGKQQAVRAFLGHILQTGKPLRIDISSDESLNWMVSDFAYVGELQSFFPKLTEQGCTCRRIVGPLSSLDYSYASLTLRWMPFYISGRVEPYYYPRLRDALYRKTMLVAGGEAAVFSSSTAGETQNSPCFFTTDAELVASVEREFSAYLSMCVPHLGRRSNEIEPKRFCSCISEFWRMPTPCLMQTPGLSAITTPPELLRGMKLPEPFGLPLFREQFLQQSELFEEGLKEWVVVDIMKLAEVDEIRNGLVPMYAMQGLSANACYSAAQYKRHLQNILRLACQYPNYRPVIQKPRWDELWLLAVKEGQRALLIRSSNPDSVFEVTERDLLSSFGELLRRSVPNEIESRQLSGEAMERIEDCIKKLS